MTRTTTGWVILIGALGMMFGLLAIDISQFMDWNEATKPAFVGSFFGHISVVITAFIGGKIIPDDRANVLSRSTDPKQGDEK